MFQLSLPGSTGREKRLCFTMMTIRHIQLIMPHHYKEGMYESVGVCCHAHSSKHVPRWHIDILHLLRCTMYNSIKKTKQFIQ
jgi:hypothetical protein